MLIPIERLTLCGINSSLAAWHAENYGFKFPWMPKFFYRENGLTYKRNLKMN